jgi:hypothetical protein
MAQKREMVRTQITAWENTSLYIPPQPNSITSAGLSWRSNVCFIHSICPICHHSFNRAHLIRCDLYKLVHVKIEDVSQKESFQSDLKELQKIKGLDTDCYTLLDFYLNNEAYVEFQNLYQNLKHFLTG